MLRECNFRRGRGYSRERRLALSAERLAATLEWLDPWTLKLIRYMRAMAARTL